MDGFINIDKPSGMTSADVIFRLKKLLFPKFGRFKMGHAGTLDPMATGVLPVACGIATKALPFMPDTGKAYVFDITFGASTATDDAEGEALAATDRIPERNEIEKILASFTGEIMQVPPAYSAIRVGGRRAYALARSGETPILKPRPQVVYSLKLIDPVLDGSARPEPVLGERPVGAAQPGGAAYKSVREHGGQAATPRTPDKTVFRFEVAADRGFYVRSLARDMALALGSLGFASMIRRTKSGPFDIKDGITLDKLAEAVDNASPTDTRAEGFCLDISAGLDGIPVADVDEGRNRDIRGGRAVPFEIGDFPLLQIRFDGELSAMAKSEKGKIFPIRVFNME